MRVNGKEVVLSSNQRLLDFLDSQQYDPKKIAIERNGEIVPKSLHGSVALASGDQLEIVVAVGGG